MDVPKGDALNFKTKNISKIVHKNIVNKKNFTIYVEGWRIPCLIKTIEIFNRICAELKNGNRIFSLSRIEFIYWGFMAMRTPLIWSFLLEAHFSNFDISIKNELNRLLINVEKETL